jgi:LysM repeat protein
LLLATREYTPTPAPLTPLPTGTPTITPTPIIYSIKSGDNLLSIANRYGVTVLALQEANGILDPRRLQIGQELVVPLDESALVEPPTPTPTPLPVSIEGGNFLETPAGGVWCLGEVRNLAGSAVELVKIQASLYDSQGSPVAYRSVFTALDEIPPGERSPFAILFDKGPLNFYTYQIVALSAVPARTDGRRSTKLVTTSLSGEAIGPTGYALQGQVYNEDEEPLESIYVVATLYDAEGRVIGMRKVQPRETVLEAGGRTTFEAIFLGLRAEPAAHRAMAQGLRGE